MNFFAFMGIPVSFQPDEAALRRLYYENSRKYHPDFHTLADPAQQAEMLEQATLNNLAWKTLSDPDLRIAHILEIYDMAPETGVNPKMPQAFLMDMMDINESLMSLEFNYDAGLLSETVSKLDRLENDLQKEIAPVMQFFNPDKPEGLEKIQEFYFKRRYLLRIRENLSKFAPT